MRKSGGSLTGCFAPPVGRNASPGKLHEEQNSEVMHRRPHFELACLQFEKGTQGQAMG